MKGWNLLSAVLIAAGVSEVREVDGVATLVESGRGCGAVFCAWCGNFLRLAPGLPRDAVSHGVCDPPCLEAVADGWGEVAVKEVAHA